MSCVLRIGGADFDVDGFMQEAGLNAADWAVRYKGRPRFKTKPEKGVIPFNSAGIRVGPAGFEDFAGQKAQAIAFLTGHRAALNVLKAYQTDWKYLDFGINTRMYDTWAQTDYFPAELLLLLGELDLGLELSQYRKTIGRFSKRPRFLGQLLAYKAWQPN